MGAMEQHELEMTISRLRRQGSDDALIEAKTCDGGLPRDVWESVSAFANTGGGTILLGVDERHGFHPASGFDLEKVRDQFVSGIGDGGRDNTLLANPPRYSMQRLEFEGTQLLAIEVLQNDVLNKPCFILRRGIQGGSYKRVDDKDIQLSPTEVYELQNALVPSGADARLVTDATMGDLDEDGLALGLARVRSSRARALRGTDSLDQECRRLGIADEGHPSLAGLLCFGVYPQQFFRSFVVDVAVHAGTRKAMPGLPRFLDREVCEGTVLECVEDAVTAVVRNLRTRSYVEGTGRYDVLEIPEEVIREAIANAVVHREYGEFFCGQPVSVDVFSDRIVVTSPGGLWGGKTLDSLGDGVTRCRNDLLMKLLRMTSVGGDGPFIAEGQGSGIPMMREEMRAAGLPEPEFSTDIDLFRVTLWRPGGRRTEGVRIRLSMRSPSEQAVLSSISSTVPRSARDISKETGLSLATVRVHLKKLVDAGVIIPTAGQRSKNRRYLLHDGASAQTDLVWDVRG